MGEDASAMKTLVSTTDALVDVMETLWDVMVGNPLLLMFMAGSLLCVGIRIFRKIKSAAKG